MMIYWSMGFAYFASKLEWKDDVYRLLYMSVDYISEYISTSYKLILEFNKHLKLISVSFNLAIKGDSFVLQITLRI